MTEDRPGALQQEEGAPPHPARGVRRGGLWQKRLLKGDVASLGEGLPQAKSGGSKDSGGRRNLRMRGAHCGTAKPLLLGGRPLSSSLRP